MSSIDGLRPTPSRSGADDTTTARALANPARLTLLRLLRDAGRPRGVGELADTTASHHLAVRRHLAALRDAGLVHEAVAHRAGPGRPPLQYSLTPQGAVAAGPEPPYRRLATLLAAALASGTTPRRVGRRAGRDLGASIAGSGLDGVVRALTAEGFAPRVEGNERAPGTADIVLGHCPYADAAVVNRDSVCALHLGIADGLAEVAGGVSVLGLEPHDPHQAGCRLTVRIRRPAPDRSSP